MLSSSTFQICPSDIRPTLTSPPLPSPPLRSRLRLDPPTVPHFGLPLLRLPWPDTVTRNGPECPHYMEVMDYIKDYARHFDVMRYVRLGQKVLALDYEGPLEEEKILRWKLWGSAGQPFAGAGGGPGGLACHCAKC